MARTIIYTDCPTCGEEVTIIEVERAIHHGDMLEPEENGDLREAIYGPGLRELPDERPEPVITCSKGHSLRGAVIKPEVVEE